MITIPVLKNFSQDETIGTLTIDETQLPEYPDFHLGLGYRVISMSKDGNIENYELVCVSTVKDSKFSAYTKIAV